MRPAGSAGDRVGSAGDRIGSSGNREAARRISETVSAPCAADMRHLLEFLGACRNSENPMPTWGGRVRSPPRIRDRSKRGAKKEGRKKYGGETSGNKKSTGTKKVRGQKSAGTKKVGRPMLYKGREGKEGNGTHPKRAGHNIKKNDQSVTYFSRLGI